MAKDELNDLFGDPAQNTASVSDTGGGGGGDLSALYGESGAATVAPPPPPPAPKQKKVIPEPEVPLNPAALGSYGAGRELLRGMTGSASDYLGAAANVASNKIGNLVTGTDRPLSFNQALKDQGQTSETESANHPIAAPVTEFAGGVMSPLFGRIGTGAKGLVAGLPKYFRYGEYPLAGFLTGETTGALGARDKEGGVPTSQDVQDNMDKQGMIGTVLGTVLPPAIYGGVKTVNAVRKLPQLVDEYGQKVSDNVQEAISRITRSISRDNEAATAMGQTANGTDATRAGLQALGPAGMIGDVGKNLPIDVERLAAQPGASVAMIARAAEARQSAANDRVVGSITTNLADPAFYDTLDVLRQNRQDAADPLRQRAFTNAAGNPIDSPIIRQFMAKSPYFWDAMSLGKKLALEESAQTGFDIPTSEAWAHTDFLGQDPNINNYKPVPTLRMLDAVKKGYNGLLRPFRNQFTNQIDEGDEEAGKLVKSVTMLNDVMRDYSPEYGQYLDSFAEPSDMMRAVKAGKAFFGMKPDEVSRVWDGKVTDPDGGMSDVQKQFAKIGFAKALVDKAGDLSDNSDPYIRLLGTANRRQVAQKIFGNDFPAFESDMQNEGTFATHNQNWLRNSRTALRVNPDDKAPGLGTKLWDLGKEGVSLASALLSHDVPNSVMAAARAKNAAMAFVAPKPQIATETTRRLISQDPAVQRQTLDLVDQLNAARAARAQQAALGARFGQNVTSGILSSTANNGPQ